MRNLDFKTLQLLESIDMRLEDNNKRLDAIIEAFNSWQAQDEHYHKKTLEGNYVRKG